MGDMLSQAEIDALLGGGSSADDTTDISSFEIPDIDEINDISQYVSSSKSYDDAITVEQKDILGEIGNISMGTAATTLFALLNQKVWITTPKVQVYDWRTLSGSYDRPCVGIRVDYKEGLKGSNILILKERDVKIIADLMMGGSGQVDEPVTLTELDLSAIGEAMNQMVGSSSTSLSSMIKQKIDINTPQPFVLDFKDNTFFDTIGFLPEDVIVCIAFKMEIGTLIDSEIMQILPLDFAIDMVEKLKSDMIGVQEPAHTAPSPQASAPKPAPQAAAYTPPPAQQGAPAAQTAPQYGYAGTQGAPPQGAPGYGYPPYGQPYMVPPGYAQMPYPQGFTPDNAKPEQPINVQPAQFQSFDMGTVMQQKENMGIIMDVPLEITVELGRTRKKISEILEFSPGTIVDLDKLAGENIDILVNGKFVAKGEVVVIDENFGIRITDIISVEKRI